TIARNLAFNHMTSAYHRHIEQGLTLQESVSEETQIDTWAEDWDQQRHLQAALVHLSFEQREVISLRFHQEMSVKDVAVLLGIPAGTVKSRTFQALQRLREYLENNHLQVRVERKENDHE